MRENESDNGDGWRGPDDYISPWAARDPGGTDQAPADGPDLPPESGQPDTIAFGKPTNEAGGAGQSSYVQRGYGDPWYGGDRDEPGYGSYADPGGRYGSGSSAHGPGDSEGDGYGSGASGGDWEGDGYGSGASGGDWEGDGYGSGASGGGFDSGGSEGGFGSGGSQGGYGSGGSGSGGFGSGGWDPGPAPRRRRHLLVYLTVAAVAAVIGAGLTVAFSGSGSSATAGASSSDVPSPHNNQASSGPGLNQATVERKVKPGLVDITSTLTYASETAEGTGMILSPSGLVLTNNHVIDGATEVTVKLADNSSQSYTARVVGYDSTDDVALLKLTGASGLATVSFGNSSQVRVGIPVLALGDAEGKGGVTPALGAISALNRSIQASDEGSNTTEDLNHMLETNAQIQQGDSGGALANNAGQVIGMVTAANTEAGGQPGGTMGFAIPINTALKIAGEIASEQSSSTVYIGLPGFLGVEVAQSNSPDPQQQAADERQADGGQDGSGPGGGRQGGPHGSLACVTGGQEPGVPERIAPASSGALILGVVCGSAAQTQGLKAGDVIISVNGQAVTTPGSLTAITAKYHPRDVVSVAYQAINGSQHRVRILLGDGPAR
jgi:S1-C subfamily serine protease